MGNSLQESKTKDDGNYKLPATADLKTFDHGHWHAQNDNIQSEISGSQSHVHGWVIDQIPSSTSPGMGNRPCLKECCEEEGHEP